MVKIGWEFEFIVPKGIGIRKLKKIFSDEMQDVVVMNGNSKLSYVITTDDSVCPMQADTAAYNFTGYEFITPPMSYKKAMQVMQKVFDIFKKYNFKTNKTTGLHANIDIGSKTKTIDPIALPILFNDQRKLIQWNRMRNYYCRSLEMTIRNRISKINSRFYNHKENSLTDIILNKYILDELFVSKFVTINFANEKYIEFRIIGGKDYDKKQTQIEKLVNQYIQCMHDAADLKHDNVLKNRFRKNLINNYGVPPMHLHYDYYKFNIPNLLNYTYSRCQL